MKSNVSWYCHQNKLWGCGSKSLPRRLSNKRIHQELSRSRLNKCESQPNTTTFQSTCIETTTISERDGNCLMKVPWKTGCRNHYFKLVLERAFRITLKKRKQSIAFGDALFPLFREAPEIPSKNSLNSVSESRFPRHFRRDNHISFEMVVALMQVPWKTGFRNHFNYFRTGFRKPFKKVTDESLMLYNIF